MNNHVQSARNVLRRWAAAAAVGGLWLICGSANAQAYDWAFERVMRESSAAATDSYKWGGAGATVPGTVPKPVPDGASGLPIQSNSTVTNPAGNRVPVTVRGRVTNAQAAMLIGKALAKTITPIAAGMAIYDLAQELKFSPAEGSTDGSEWDKMEAGGFIYWQAQNQLPFATVAEGRAKHQMALYGRTGNEVQPYFTTTCGERCLEFRYPPYAANNFVGQYKYVDVRKPSTVAELEAAIASQSGWPSTSKLPEALAWASQTTGERAKVENPTVTGPATSPGKTTTRTSTNPDGSTRTETTTCTYNHTYSGAAMTTAETCQTTVTNDGEAGKTTTQTNSTDAPDKNGTDSESEDCAKNPDPNRCGAEFDTPTGEIPKTTAVLTYVAESLGLGGGSCPSDIVQTLGGRSVTVFSYAKGCDLLRDYVKPIVLLLSSWIAFIILIPGAKPE